MSEIRDLKTEEVLRDISIQLGALTTSMDDIKKDVGEIKIQTTKTKGRVGKLESWRSYLAGGFGVIIAFISAFLKLHK